MKSHYYITTPIYYVNDVPHIGHAYTTIACDVLARFMRLDGREVKFLTGTDEHGQKVEKSALKVGKNPQEFTDELSKSFINLTKLLNISNDDFIRTTEPRHKNAALALWERLVLSGDIYLGKYCGWYSVRDEAFYAKSELDENNLAPTGSAVEWIEEPSYFFALSKWSDKLLEFYENNPDFINPKSRRNEIISFVKSGLEDLSISRTSFSWGIKIPNDPDHIMYVWLDALTNYISALGYPDNNNEDYKKYWDESIHIIGKDITRFHAVYWPAFLMAASLTPPKKIFAHGWWTNEGEKISKSLGNTIDPVKLVEDYGIDQTRYFLMREMVFGNDGNFSKTQLIARINNELANKIGNLVQRVLTFTVKNCNSIVPNVNISRPNELIQKFYKAKEDFVTYMEHENISEVLAQIVNFANEMNIFVDHNAPWTLKNQDEEKMKIVIFELLEMIRCLAIFLQPFIPESAEKILNAIDITDNKEFKYLNWENRIKSGNHVKIPEVLFPKIN